MFTESAEYIFYIFRCDGSDNLLIGGSNIGRTCNKNFLDNSIVDFTLGFLHKHLPHGKSTLISAELFGIHFSCLRSAVYHIQNVHSAVANIRNNIDSVHCGSKVRNGGVPLRIDTDTLNRDMIVHLLIGETDLFVFVEISGKVLFLSACPSQGQACGDNHLCFGQLFTLKLLRNGNKGEDIIVLVTDFVGKELLVSFFDQIIFAVVYEHISRKQRLGIVCEQSGLKAAVRRFHIPISVVDADNVHFIKILHFTFLLFLL